MKKIAELRKKKKITQAKLAEVIGVGRSTLAMYETDNSEPDFVTVSKLADFFEVSVDYLLGRDEIPLDSYFLQLPVLGSIRAGYGGALVEEVTGDYQEVPPSLIRGYTKDELMVLVVKGDSMYPDFRDGDRVLIHKQESVDSGDIAAFIYDGDDATIKKVRYVSGQNWLELIPRNPEFKTKRIEGADLQECRVIGKVIYLLFRKI